MGIGIRRTRKKGNQHNESRYNGNQQIENWGNGIGIRRINTSIIDTTSINH